MIRLPLLLAACLALAGCATGQGNNGPYYPGGSGGYGDRYGSERFIATVESVDPRTGRLLLVAGDPRSYQRSRVEVYFDNNTALYYRGQRYPVEGLERGDEVEVEAMRSGGRLWASRIQVVRNIRESGGYRY
ncbi:MAG: hypothetical protein M3Y70_08335 [Pseudomonadota bacterium]|nr:hypothetical protein [Pseudomonadota bacterium]